MCARPEETKEWKTNDKMLEGDITNLQVVDIPNGSNAVVAEEEPEQVAGD